MAIAKYLLWRLLRCDIMSKSGEREQYCANVHGRTRYSSFDVSDGRVLLFSRLSLVLGMSTG